MQRIESCGHKEGEWLLTDDWASITTKLSRFIIKNYMSFHFGLGGGETSFFYSHNLISNNSPICVHLISIRRVVETGFLYLCSRSVATGRRRLACSQSKYLHLSLASPLVKKRYQLVPNDDDFTYQTRTSALVCTHTHSYTCITS